MGGRGSGGSRGGGSASKTTTANEKNLTKAQNYLAKAYKYQDEYDDYSDFASHYKSLAKRFKNEGNQKKAEYYERHSKNFKDKANKIKRKLDRSNSQAEKLGNLKQQNIPKSYQYEGEQGTRRVFKSPQAAKEQWKSSTKSMVSTAYRDQPTIVHAPNGGYSVVPHGLVKRNNLKEIRPYEIKDID